MAGSGALLATALLAAAPIYADTMSEAGLRFRLDRSFEEPRNQVAFVSVDGLRLGDPASPARQDAIDAITRARVGWLGAELIVEQRSDPLGLALEDGQSATGQARLVYLSGFEQHVTVVDGRLPSQDAGVAEVVLPEGFRGEVAVGDRIVLSARTYDDCQRIPGALDLETAADEVRCRPTTFVTPSVTAIIVGIVRPNDPDDPRWGFFEDGWAIRDGGQTPAGTRSDQSTTPLLTTRNQYFEVFAARLPELGTRHRAGIVPAVDTLAVRDLPRAIDDLRAWPQDIRRVLGLPVIERIEFVEALARFRNDQTFSRIPLLLLLLQVSGVAAFYVVMIAAFMQERQSNELAVYRSRGASTTQLLGLSLVEAFLIAVPAAVIGPFLAAGAVAALGFTPAFDAITAGSALPASVSGDAFLFAAGGAALALVAMLLPVIASAGRAIVDVKLERSRPPRQGVVQRYYLDLFAIPVAALLVWQLNRRGTVFDPRSVGGWEADPLLLLSPLILTATAAALILRFYPPVLRLLARTLRPLPGATITLGLGRAGRDSSSAVRLLLLISTAVAVGTFAASYSPTIERSLEDRILYETGVDARGTLVSFELPGTQDGLAAVRGLAGVDDAVLVHRGAIGAPDGSPIALLAVDDLDRAAEMIWFREDFADEPPAELLGRIEIGSPPGGGLTLPGDTVAIELAALTEQQPRIGRIRGQLRDIHGNYREVVFDPVGGAGWSRLRAELSSEYDGPLTLVSLRLADRLVFVSSDGAIYFDDLTAVRRDGERVVLDGFEDRFDWTMYSQRASTESFSQVSDRVFAGQSAARWSWTKEVAQRERVFALNDPSVPLNAIMSQRALTAFDVQPGDRLSLLVGNGFAIPMAVRGSARLFPTLDPERGFVIVQLDQLRSIAGAVASDATQAPNELWIDFDDGLALADEQAILDLLGDPDRSPLLISNPRHRAGLLAELAADPILQASGSGILLFAMAGVMSVAMLGFAVTLGLTLRERIVEFSVLRALGLSRLGILRAMLLEWGLVLLLGALVGVLLGRQIARLMLRFLEVTEDGERVVPGFSLAFDLGLLGGGLATLGVVAAIALLGSWRLALRRANASALRLTP